MNKRTRHARMKSYCGNRLDIKTMLDIANKFNTNIKVIGWDEWGQWGHTKKAFMPFESLDHYIKREWLKVKYPTGVPKKPEGADGCDVIWMPEGKVGYFDGKYHNFMIFDKELGTNWSPKLVAKKDGRIMVWDWSIEEWTEFVIEPFEYTNNDGTKTYTHKAFAKFLRAWLPW